jgi:galactofuranose transport system substrate-binding protein
MPGSSSARGRRLTAVAALAAAVTVAASGCAKSAGTSTQAGGNGGGSVNNTQNAQQTASASASGPACTYQQYAGGVPKLDPKSITVGFSQSESTSNPFRATETSSIEAEAKKEGIKLIERNANADVNAQNSQIQDMIAQGAQFLIVAPENSDGLRPALAAAAAKKIPVLTIDRTVQGTACQDFIAFIGSNFFHQAQIAADDMGAALDGKGNVAIITGTPGNNVTTDRNNGFVQEMQAKYPGVKIAAQQPGNFDQTQGQKVMEQLLQSNPDLNGVYTESDNMALGAMQAIRAAGKTPGKDIKIVTIDGIQQAVQGVADGTIVADVETNPRFGPLAFQAMQNFYGTQGVQNPVIIEDHHFTKQNAADALKNGLVY